MLGKKRKSGAIILLLVLSLIFLLGGCTDKEQPEAVDIGSKDKPLEESLPDYLTIASYDVGSNTFTQAAALGEGILKKTGIKTRQIVSGTDFGRIIPVRSGKIHFFMGTSNTIQLASTGMGPFASVEWGPQPFRQVWGTMSNTGIGIITEKNSDIKTPYDLKGKRYPYVLGNDSANLVLEAVLRFANLTWDDVVKVECPGVSESYKVLLEGKVDAVAATVVSSVFYEMAQTPRGINIVELSPEDTEGWARMKKFVPSFVPLKSVIGAGISEDNPKNIIGFAAPLVLTYPELDENIAYTMAKAIDESYDTYKELNPDLKNWAKEKSIIPDVVVCPFHEGAIKYFKEIGWWNEGLEKKQNELLQKEAIMLELWDKTVNESIEKGISSKEFVALWNKNKAEGLK